MLRPMRPKPLIPIFIAMRQMLASAALAAGSRSSRPAFVLRSLAVAVGSGQLLEPAQPVVDRGLGEIHASGELAEVQVRVLEPPPRHLAQRGRQAGEFPAGLQG